MRFGVLGPLAVWADDGQVVDVPEAKVRALLADLLVDPGRVVSADRLLEDLWGEAAPPNRAGAVQTRVSRLRRALGSGGGRELVVHRPPGYLLRVPAEAVDAGRFEALTVRARRAADPGERAALLTEALGLWRGPAFADFADEPFAQGAIARLEERRLLALEEWAEARLELGEYGAVVAELGELVARHPLRERLRAAQLRALYQAGRTGEALASYERLRRQLAEQLGADPGPELAAVHAEILRQAPALRPEPARRVAGNLPTPVSELVGREAVVARVGALLAGERLVTLTGPGGVGKTRLAIEAAHQQEAAFPDGRWLIELAPPGHGPGVLCTAEEMAAEVAVVLGLGEVVGSAAGSVTEAPPRLPRAWESLAAALRGRRLLLVLDNCEALAEPVATLAEALLRLVPGLRILATSKEPLGLSGERLWAVEPLAEPDAVRLFAARAAAASPGFALTEDTAPAVASICRRLDGIPLALELAARRVRVLGVRELARRLAERDHFGLLTGGPRDAPARQRTLRAVIDWSWELLTEAERVVLRRLTMLVEGGDLAAAEAVCAADGAGEVLDVLGRLVDRSLVVASGDPPRYRLLESVAAYAAERLREAGEEELTGARRRHAAHFLALAEETEPGRLAAAENGNMRAAIERAAAAGESETALRLALATSWHWLPTGRAAEARRAFELALSAEGRAPRELRSRAEARLAELRAGPGLVGVEPVSRVST